MGKSKEKSSKKDQKRKHSKDSDEKMEDNVEKQHDKKNRAHIRLHGVDNASTFEHPASFAFETGQLDPSSLKHFAKHVQIDIKKLDSQEIVFDLAGAEPPLANALRRIMIAEIPTIAIEKVTIWQNTSIIPDENLAHRLGLIPLNVDARLLDYHKDDEQYKENNSLKFKLHKICTKKDPNAPLILNETHDDSLLYNNANVYSGDLEWIPLGNQLETLGNVKPLHDDILITKLRPGQEIEIEMICEKGIGKTHAKWSPVCTAFYRLLPDIKFEQSEKPIIGKEAHQLKKLCPMGVFDIEDIGGIETAVVGNSRKCTTCRECIRHEKFQDRINLGKMKDVFEFHVESLGMYKPQDIVLQSINILKEKVDKWIAIVNEYQTDEQIQSIS